VVRKLVANVTHAASRELAQTLRYVAGSRFCMNQRICWHVASPRRDAACKAGLPLGNEP
jgi:hypothetical protein